MMFEHLVTTLLYAKEFLLLSEVSMFPILERMSIRLEALAVQVVMVRWHILR